MTPQAVVSMIQVADATGDRERCLVAIQALRDALDGGLLEIVAGPRAHPHDRALERSRPFAARRAGRCAQCDRNIAEGEMVTYSRVDRTIWCAPSCERAAEGMR